MPKVSELDELTAAAVQDPSAIYLLTSDAQSTLTSKYFPLDELGRFMGVPGSHVATVIGTGVAATDTAAFTAATLVAGANSTGAILIHGKVTLNTSYNFTTAVSLYGVPGTGAEIELTDNSYLGWNTTYNPLSGSSTSITATAAKQAYIKVATGTLTQGQWFFALADDTIEGVTHSNGTVTSLLSGATADAGTDKITYTSHGLSDNTAVILTSTGTMPGGLSEETTYWVVNKTANDFQVAATRAGSAIDITSAGTGTLKVKNITANCPMELHQVKEIRETSGGYDYIVFDDFIVDALTVNPRVVAVTSPTEGVCVKGIRFSWTGTSTPTNSTLQFMKCFNVTVENCVWENNGPNEVFFLYCAQATITNCKMESRKGYNTSDGYAVVAGTSTDVIFSNSICKGQRHAFTTSAVTSNGARYGTVRNCLVQGVIAHQSGRTDSTLIAFDTHAEGWGVVFDSCYCYVPYDPRNPSVASPTYNTNIAFQSRSRHTLFRNCHVFGSGLTYGFNLLGSDHRVEHCTVQGGWRGIRAYEDTTGLTSGANRAIIKYCSIEDLSGDNGGAGVILEHGTNHVVAHCDFYDVAGTGSYGGIDPGCVFIGEGTGHRILNNTMNKVSNKYCIAGTGFDSGDVEITGNSMIGYTGVSGVTDSGFSTSNADSTALQLLADTYNWTD